MIRRAMRLFLIAVTALTVHSAQAITNGLVLYYSFDVNQGGTVIDESGTGNDGTVDGATYTAAGHSGGAYDFDGVNDHIRVPDDTSLNATSFTVSAWVQTRDQSVTIERGVTGKHKAGDNNSYFWLFQSTNRLDGLVVGAGETRLTNSIAPFVNTWGLATLTYDGGTSRLYVDGSLVDEVAVAGYGGNGYDLLIGAGEFSVSDGNQPQRWWNGLIDEFRMYDRALSSNEILTIYNLDAREPNDEPEAAEYIQHAVTNGHAFATTNDADWSLFCAVTNYDFYEVETTHRGTNVDTAIDVFISDTNGALTSVGTADSNTFGLAAGETFTIDSPSNASYFVKVSASPGSVSGNQGWGAGSEYDLVMTADGAPFNVIWVTAFTQTEEPVGIWASVNSVTQQFNGGVRLLFEGVPLGDNTVYVHTVSGVLPAEHKTLPGQTSNIYSQTHGNPRIIDMVGTMRAPRFDYDPVSRSSARVRDAWTHTWISDIDISFQSTNVASTNAVDYRSGHPHNTSYESNWTTRADGTFPNNVYLLPVAWDLILEKPGYGTNIFADKVPATAWGGEPALGTIEIAPLDANSNNLPDSWEEQYFGAGTNVNPAHDPDLDLLDNRSEYLTGTNPNDPADHFRMTPTPTGETTKLSWPAKAWCLYEIYTKDNPTNSWSAIGPLTNAARLSTMEWIDTAGTNKPSRSYKMGLIVPD